MYKKDREKYNAYMRQYKKKWYQKNKEQERERARKWYHTHKDKAKAYWKAHPEKRRRFDIQNRYGITLEDYEKLYTEQGGHCAICNKHQTELNSKLAVDHCHTSKVVRGLLCRTCNAHLGWYEKWQTKAENYLKNS